MGKMMKKYESGEASQYMSRKMALRKLQLSLKMFRRLCILKGIYPREPKNRKRAQKGSTEKKTLYLKKDIQFLLHEPIMWKLRDHKVFLRKKNRAKMLRDKETMRRVLENRPTYRLDHIVKERYPTFIDALRDLDDCLTLCFLFSTFPSLRFVPGGVSKFCRRLTVEFMHYVIEAKALRKVFVSIKGYYYQADIKGQTVTWIVPHNFGFQPQTSDDVDFRIMATFVEFYNTVLGFINFRLFHSLNVCYPPKLVSLPGNDKDENEEEKELATEEELVFERVAALNQKLLRAEDVAEEQVPEIDEFPSSEDQAKLEELKKEAERIKKLKTLFEGMKFFLNREVPREPLTFVIRSAGGQVSWDKLYFPGAIFNEDDKTITHQIVDRNVNEKQYLSRYYIQPQWIFDCFNARHLLPVEKYFSGAVLPPHLSPFLTEREGDYVPPEKKKFFDMENGITNPADPMELPKEAEEEEEEAESEGDESEEEEMEDDDEGVESNEEGEQSDAEEEEDEEEEELDEEEAKKKSLKKQMGVEKGMVEEIDEIAMKDGEDKEQYRLRVMMIKNKHKRLYKRMMDSRHRRRREADRLTSKRIQIEDSEKAKKKSTKKIK